MLRFSIRDVLWLTVVVGLALGWRVGDARLKAERDKISEKAKNLEQDSNRWKGRAGTLAQQLGEFGIPVVFKKSGGMGIGPIPPWMTPPAGPSISNAPTVEN